MIRIEKISSWEELQKNANSMILWGFRGQQDSQWPLETTLHRLARENNLNSKDLWHKEYWLIRQFSRRAHNYYGEYQQNKSPLEWLALMQHHGAPTRLLDFSHSIYIAAFFALENATSDSAIWCLNIERIREDNSTQFQFNRGALNIDGVNVVMNDEVNKLISTDGAMPVNQKPFIAAIEPVFLHERLMNQQGFFIFPNNMEMSIEENMFQKGVIPKSATDHLSAESFNTLQTPFPNHHILEPYLIKYEIPISLRVSILRNLEAMNISARTLFPGLDGFARSMRGLCI